MTAVTGCPGSTPMWRIQLVSTTSGSGGKDTFIAAPQQKGVVVRRQPLGLGQPLADLRERRPARHRERWRRQGVEAQEQGRQVVAIPRRFSGRPGNQLPPDDEVRSHRQAGSES
jgi:hypothetical protein